MHKSTSQQQINFLGVTFRRHSLKSQKLGTRMAIDLQDLSELTLAIWSGRILQGAWNSKKARWLK